MRPTSILLPIASFVLLASAARSPRPDEATADDILAHTRAAYAALKSYADTGTVVLEYGQARDPSHDRHSFRTYYRAPRLFFFEFVKEHDADRLVVWSDPEAFHSWWRSTGAATAYPKGQGNLAFLLAESPTNHSVTQVAALLFATAGLTSTLTEFGDATDAGMENVAGHPCHRLVGVAQSTYGKTGRVFNVRRTTIWVDAESYLVRKVLEDSPEGTALTLVSRMTMTFSPHADPVLEDARFHFIPSSEGR
jgi:outer membrane lipoprotein-sorting protein